MVIELDTEALEAFVKNVSDFDQLEASQKIPFFAYHILEIIKQEYFTSADVKACFTALHIKPYSNIPAFISTHTKGNRAIFISKGRGYRIERTHLRDIQSQISASPIIQAAKSSLRNHVKNSLPEFSKVFLEEAIQCFEYRLYRSSIVMVWLFVIDHLYEYVIYHKLKEFNNVYAKDTANKKGLQIAVKDDFTELREEQFIGLCRSANIISNDVRKILEQKLGIRNTYAHPANITITEAKCSDFITDLLDNIVAKYSL